MNGEKIAYYRKLRGMSQSELAERADIPLGSIKKYEINNRNPKKEVAYRIADALNISANAFVDIKTESAGDVMAIFLLLEHKGICKISRENQKVCLLFENQDIIELIEAWTDVKEKSKRNRGAGKRIEDEKTKQFLLARAEELETEFELRAITTEKKK